MDKFQYLRKLINESIEETVTGFDDFGPYMSAANKSNGDFDHQSMKNGINPNPKMIFVYHGTNDNQKALDSMASTGGSGAKEFYGKAIGQIHGRGIYTMLNFKDVCYGNGAIVRYAVKPGAFDNFIIWEDNLRDLLWKRGAITRQHETIPENIKRLVDDETWNYLKNNYYGNIERGISEGEFFRLMTIGERRSKHGNFGEETRLDFSQIDGFVIHHSGPCAVFRTADILIPNKIYRRGESSEDNGNYAVTDPNKFDDLNTYTDAYRRSRKEYPDTEFHEKSVAGFTFVKVGNKGNWVNGRTGELFSPIPLSNCAGFNVLNHSATFTLGKYEFMVKSLDYARNLEIFVRPLGGKQWKELEGGYSKFLAMMNNMVAKRKAATGAVNESVDEAFMNGSFDDFINKEIPNTVTLNKPSRYSSQDGFNGFANGVKGGKNIYFYTCSDTANIKSMLTNGATYEFTGTSSDTTTFQGIVCYGAFSLAAAEHNMRQGYGNTIFKFVLKDDLSKYIIFDPRIRKALTPQNASLTKQLIDMCGDKTYRGKKLIDILDYGLKNPKNGFGGSMRYKDNSHLHSKGVYGMDNLNPDRQGDIAANFFQTLKGELVGGINSAKQYDEMPLFLMGVAGYIYNGGQHWDCIGVRNYNALMPVAYATATRSNDPNSIPRDEGGRVIWKKNEYMNAEWFDKLNKNVTARYQYSGEYEGTPLKTKQTCGYTLVNGSRGFNYMDVMTHRHLLPIDVDSANVFNPMANTASFNFLGAEWKLVIDEGGMIHLQLKGHDVPPAKFLGLVQKAKGMGKLEGKPIHNDSVLLSQAKGEMNEAWGGKNKTTNKGLVGGLLNLKRQEEKLNAMDLSLFTTPKAMQYFTAIARAYERAATEKAKEVITNNLNKFFERGVTTKAFVDQDAVEYAAYAVFGNKNRFHYDSSTNHFTEALSAKALADIKGRSAKAQEKKREGLSDNQKKRLEKQDNAAVFGAKCDLNALNFYSRMKYEFPIDIRSYKTDEEKNAALEPYFEKEPLYNTYMKVVNYLKGLIMRNKLALYYFDGEAFYTPTYGKNWINKDQNGRVIGYSFSKDGLGNSAPPLYREVINKFRALGFNLGKLTIKRKDGVPFYAREAYIEGAQGESKDINDIEA